MIRITTKSKCVGCSACAQRCPRHCIQMKEDEQGFLYPQVDENSCNNCSLCEKVCPVITQIEERIPLESYAASNINEQIRKQSSSGGVFTTFATHVINNEGVVFGACFDENWTVIHDYADNLGGLEKFRGSKYVQSTIGNSFQQAEQFLKNGKIVLFSGTPCQIAALKLYLHKDYNNLITIDFICHGVPSPGVFRWYLQEVVNNNSSQERTKSYKILTYIPKHLEIPDDMQIEKISFRDKTEGWRKSSFSIILNKLSRNRKSRKEVRANLRRNLYLRGFLKDLYLRPSCHECPAKCLKGNSDITIADYWGITEEYGFPDMETGVSAVMLNTVAGQNLFEKCCTELNYRLADFDDIKCKNGALTKSSILPVTSSQFWNDVELGCIDRLIKYAKMPFKEEAKLYVKDAMRNILPSFIIKRLRNYITI